MTKKESISEIQSYIEAIEKSSEPYQEKNFDKRVEVIDFIEFHIIDQIEELRLKTVQQDKLISLKLRAEKVKTELEEIDSSLFQKLLANIRTEGYTGKEFQNLINEYVDFNLENNEHQ